MRINEEKIEIVANTRRKSYADAARYDQNMSCKKDIDSAKLYEELLVCDKSMSSDMDGSPPNLCTNSAEVSNSPNSVTSQKDFIELSLQDEELFSILGDLQHNEMPGNINVSNRIQGYFCSDIVFNLSKKVLSETKIKVLEKGLDFAPIQNKINESELRKDFEEYFRRMRIKWHFRNDVTPRFSEIPACTPKSKWQPLKGHPIHGKAILSI